MRIKEQETRLNLHEHDDDDDDDDEVPICLQCLSLCVCKLNIYGRTLVDKNVITELLDFTTRKPYTILH